MFDKLHIFLGATVADAAARPLHWVYDKKKLNSYIKGKKDIAFFKQNRSPFYSIKTGEVSVNPYPSQIVIPAALKTRAKRGCNAALPELMVWRLPPNAACHFEKINLRAIFNFNSYTKPFAP